MGNQATYRLPFTFDVAKLRTELDEVAGGAWRHHYKPHHYSGDWTALALRSHSGAVDDLSTGPTGTEFLDTPLLERTPYIRTKVLGEFAGPLRREAHEAHAASE